MAPAPPPPRAAAAAGWGLLLAPFSLPVRRINSSCSGVYCAPLGAAGAAEPRAAGEAARGDGVLLLGRSATCGAGDALLPLRSRNARCSALRPAAAAGAGEARAAGEGVRLLGRSDAREGAAAEPPSLPVRRRKSSCSGE